MLPENISTDGSDCGPLADRMTLTPSVDRDAADSNADRANQEVVTNPPDARDPAIIAILGALSCRRSSAMFLFIDPDEGGSLDARALAWLVGQGVAIGAVASPIAIRAARISVGADGRYRPNAIGEFAFIIPVIDARRVVDFCAWVPRTGEIATRLGVGVLLGDELVGRDTGDGVTVPPLRVFRSPLEWLRAHRQGAVILDPTRAAVALAGVVIDAIDDTHAAELRSALRVRRPIILSRHPHRLAA